MARHNTFNGRRKPRLSEREQGWKKTPYKRDHKSLIDKGVLFKGLCDKGERYNIVIPYV